MLPARNGSQLDFQRTKVAALESIARRFALEPERRRVSDGSRLKVPLMGVILACDKSPCKRQVGTAGRAIANVIPLWYRTEMTLCALDTQAPGAFLPNGRLCVGLAL